MKAYISFENNGEVDVNAFKLLGASTKENDNTKIGFWGSGLKYAVAVLLRNNIDFKVFSGTKEIKIGTRKTKLGGESFDVITVNGSPTSITTRAGKDWELWFAIREIHCNQIDEGRSDFTVMKDPVGEKGKTRILIDLNETTNEIIKNYDKYFAFRRTPVFKCGFGSIYMKEQNVVYRKGIKASTRELPLMYDYDLFRASINESRVFSTSAEIDYHGAEVLTQCNKISVIKNICSNSSCYEQQNFWWDHFSLSEEWLSYLKTKVIFKEGITGYYKEEYNKDSLVLADHFANALQQKYGDILNFVHMKEGKKNTVKPTETALANVSTSLDRLSELDFTGLKIDYAVLDGDTCGMYEDGIIVLDINVAEEGGKMLDMTILEEYAHHVSGAEDCTRKFQTFLLRKWLDKLVTK